MKVTELEEQGYKIRTLITGQNNRGMKTILVLLRGKRVYVSASNEVGLKGEFTDPIESVERFRRLL